MARKKTPTKSGNDATAKAADPANDAAEGKVVSVTDADTTGSTASTNDPETVDAEIVSEPAAQDKLSDDTLVGANGAEVETRAAAEGEDVPPADAEGPPPGGEGGKKGGFPWGLVAAVVLIVVVAAALFALLGNDDDDVIAADETPGLVVSEAEPFPGNELDGDTSRVIEGRAAPGAREAAVEADRDRTARGAERRDRMDDVAEAEAAEAGSDDRTSMADEETEAETPESALRARAAARNRARREARENVVRPARDEQREGGDVADSDDDAPFYVADASEADEGEDAQAASDSAARRAEMAARVAAARAAQQRIANEDRAQADRPSDDPNALLEFTEETDDVPTELAAEQPEDGEGEAREALRDEGDQRDASARATVRTEDDDAAREDETAAQTIRRTIRRDTRPTGRVTRVDTDDVASADEEEAPEAAAERPARAERVRPAALTADSLPEEAATEEELNERISAVRAEVREDVLAETDARIRTAIEETEREVASLRNALSEQEQRSDQRIAQLQDRLEVLQRRDATASQQGVLILALSNLAGAVDRGEPFVRQLDDVERLAPNARSLAAARRFAQDGLPSDRVLAERFQDVARRAQAAEGREGADGLFSRLGANLRGLFSVRPIGEVEGDTPSAIISRAEGALERGDLEAAVSELEALEGPAAETFEPWIEDARNKTQVTQRIDRLERAVLARDE